MAELYYQLPGTQFGDYVPFGHGDQFYLYHQRDIRKPCPFKESFGRDLSITSNFVCYEDRGVAIPRGSDEEQDQFIFAKSMFEAEGMYHTFYTGYNGDYPKARKPSQVLVHAVSRDLVAWTRTNEALTFTPREGYGPDGWRDPFVIHGQEWEEYLLILGTRKMRPKTRQSGRTVYLTSKNLEDWEFHGDFWAPDLHIMRKMPDLFWIGDWQYHITSEYSDKNKIVYRMTKNTYGPWIAPVDDAFDRRTYYTGRTFCLSGQRVLFGWVSTKENCDDRGNFRRANTSVARGIYQRKDGTLGAKVSGPVWNVFNTAEPMADRTMDSPSRCSTYTAAKHTGNLFRFETDVGSGQGTCSSSIWFYENEDMEEGYQYIFHMGGDRCEFEKNPNWQQPTHMNVGLLCPIKLEMGRICHIRMIVDGIIATPYANGVALSARFYTKPGEAVRLFVTGGTLKATDIFWAKGIKK